MGAAPEEPLRLFTWAWGGARWHLGGNLVKANANLSLRIEPVTHFHLEELVAHVCWQLVKAPFECDNQKCQNNGQANGETYR